MALNSDISAERNILRKQVTALFASCCCGTIGTGKHRLIAAQAMKEGHPLLSTDAAFITAGVERIW